MCVGISSLLILLALHSLYFFTYFYYIHTLIIDIVFDRYFLFLVWDKVVLSRIMNIMDCLLNDLFSLLQILFIFHIGLISNY